MRLNNGASVGQDGRRDDWFGSVISATTFAAVCTFDLSEGAEKAAGRDQATKLKRCGVGISPPVTRKGCVGRPTRVRQASEPSFLSYPHPARDPFRPTTTPPRAVRRSLSDPVGSARDCTHRSAKTTLRLTSPTTSYVLVRSGLCALRSALFTSSFSLRLCSFSCSLASSALCSSLRTSCSPSPSSSPSLSVPPGEERGGDEKSSSDEKSRILLAGKKGEDDVGVLLSSRSSLALVSGRMGVLGSGKRGGSSSSSLCSTRLAFRFLGRAASGRAGRLGVILDFRAKGEPLVTPSPSSSSSSSCSSSTSP